MADDYPRTREALAEMVSGWPGFVLCGLAADGHEAEAQAIALHADVVLMDISMPGQDGLTATRRLRERAPAIHVVLVSVHDTAEWRRLGQAHGAAGFVAKAEAAVELRGVVEALTRAGSCPAPAQEDLR